MTSKLTGEGDEEGAAAVPKKALQFSAINFEFKFLNFQRGCYIFCRNAPPIPTAIILDESGAN